MIFHDRSCKRVYLGTHNTLPVDCTCGLDQQLTAREALELAASFHCERASETWVDCPTEATDEFEDITWCRSCTARAALEELGE